MRSLIPTLLVLALMSGAAQAAATPRKVIGGDMFRLHAPAWERHADGSMRFHRRDLTDARHLAQLGDLESQYNLGVMYQQADRHRAAAYWFRQAAQRGHALAEYNLGAMYYNGTGLERDPAAAAAWFQRSAARGFADAQFQLGRMHHAGEGVAPDPAAEAQWYRAAAEQGHALAQYNLAVLLHLGEGLAADPVEAWAWFATADANGLDSREALTVVEGTLDAAQRDRAAALAAEYRGAYARP
jgi:TPR repeat protein